MNHRWQAKCSESRHLLFRFGGVLFWKQYSWFILIHPSSPTAVSVLAVVVLIIMLIFVGIRKSYNRYEDDSWQNGSVCKYMLLIYECAFNQSIVWSTLSSPNVHPTPQAVQCGNTTIGVNSCTAVWENFPKCSCVCVCVCACGAVNRGFNTDNTKSAYTIKEKFVSRHAQIQT